ncbi:WD repeat-containing protein, putative [Plasmodium ovale]|uniref:WD repeat-containing protein, putative n=1 Tax=Plasmodium ovale TaxID=36330 RepID=A0A1D3THJ9_PLAOA|nr:WD repeat-containing protein, putative [Plasmodium ovale]
MDIRKCLSSEDYMFEIRNNEQLFEGRKKESNIKPIWSFKGHNNSIEGIHIIDDDKFVTISHDCVVSLWNFENNKNIRNVKLKYPILSSSYFYGRKSLCVGMTNRNNNICIIDMERNMYVENMNSGCSSIFCMNFYYNDKITYGSKDGYICLLDINKGKNIFTYDEIGDCLTFCTHNVCYNIHVFSTYKGNTLFFDYRYALPIYKNNNLHSKYAINAIYTHNNYLYTGGSDCLVKKYDIRYINECKPMEIYIGHTSPIRSLSFSSKHIDYFCSSDDNGSIKLWKTENPFDSVKKCCTSLVTLLPVGDSTTKTISSRGGKVGKTFLNLSKKAGKDFLDISRKAGKNFLLLNKKTVSGNSNRSGSIVSDCPRKKFPDSFALSGGGYANGWNGMNRTNRDDRSNCRGELVKTLDSSKKRTFTPNLPCTHNIRVPVVSRNELFSLSKNKSVYGKKKEMLNYSTKNILPESTNHGGETGRLKLEVKPMRASNRLHLPSPICHSTTSRSGNHGNGHKMGRKIPLNVISDGIGERNGFASCVAGDISEMKDNVDPLSPFLFRSEHEMVGNSTKRIQVKYASLSMLNHRGRVSSMEWTGDLLLSASWDQTVKCWDVKRYVVG